MNIDLLTGTGHSILLVLSYGLIGGLIKYIDQAFDLGVFSKKTALFLAIPTAALMGSLMALNGSSATIFLAIVIGLALTHKVDNIAFQTGLFFVILIPLFFSSVIQIQWIPFALLFAAGIGDEYTSDWADLKIKKRTIEEALGHLKPIPLKQKILEMLFEHRVLMKIMVLIVVIAGLFQPVYLLAFLAFDFTYKAVELYSLQLKRYNINKSLTPNGKTTTTA
jgi:hypothetical protein